jgi:hypothetical protein
MKLIPAMLLLAPFAAAIGQSNESVPSTQFDPPACLSSREDQKFMMDQLGIESMRPGRSPNADAPNAANYDESLANPFPVLPDLLTTDAGKQVTSPEMWYKVRRPEIAEAMEREVYGRIPENVPEVTWEVVISEREFIGWTPVNAKKLVGHVDHSAYPLIDVDIDMVVVTPARAEGPVPVLMMFGQASLPAPAQPNVEDFQKLNEAVKAMLARDPEIKEILDKYPAYDPLVRPEGVSAWGFRMPSQGEPSRTEQLIAAGWGYALINPSSIQADNGEGLTCSGIIALVNKGKPRKPDDWGALRAWAWGAARGLDYLETDSTIDAARVGIEGVSRYGKAALVTLAFEERFAFGLIGSSGKGGTTLHRRNFGESVENLTGGGYYWMAGNYMKYSAENGALGQMDASHLPVDSHGLIAMCAPRLVFISYGIPEQGDAHWLDHRGSYMAAVAAQPVFRLLGVKDMGVPDDYMHATMPPVLEGQLEGNLAWRQHEGGHTDAPNITYFIEWVNKQLEK